MTATVKVDAEHFIRLENEYGANNYHPLDVVITGGEGAWVWDVEGNRYLDFLAAYSAVNQGHAHPSIRRVLIEQAQRVTLTSRAFRTDQLGPLSKALCNLSGYARMDLRLTEDGRVYVLEANPNPNLSYGEDFAESAEKVGVSYENLLGKILSLGLRYKPAWVT